jgi:hypothetical protein
VIVPKKSWAELQQDAALMAILQKMNVSLTNVVGVQTAANDGKIVYVRSLALDMREPRRAGVFSRKQLTGAPTALCVHRSVPQPSVAS